MAVVVCLPGLMSKLFAAQPNPHGLHAADWPNFSYHENTAMAVLTHHLIAFGDLFCAKFAFRLLERAERKSWSIYPDLLVKGALLLNAKPST